MKKLLSAFLLTVAAANAATLTSTNLTLPTSAAPATPGTNTLTPWFDGNDSDRFKYKNAAGTVFQIRDSSGPETTLASATTTDLSSIESEKISITGTTTITSFGSGAAGMRKEGRFTGALTLTHNATSLILPGNASIPTAAGDRFQAYSLGSGNWVVINYTKADGTAVVSSGGGLGYTLYCGTSLTTAPNDSFTYMVGMAHDAGTSTGNFDKVRIYVPKAGTVKLAQLRVSYSAGSNETVTHYVRLNDTTDFGSQTTTYDSASGWSSTVATGLSQAVSVGDYIAFKVTTPAWATNPSGVTWKGYIYIE